MSAINPKRQACGCHAPHVLCPVGQQYAESEAQANTDAEYAAKFEPERASDRMRRLKEARAAYDRHVGIFQEPTHDVACGVDWTLVEQQGYCALVKAVRALAERVAALEAEAARPYRTTQTPALDWTETQTPPCVHGPGYPQE